MLLPLYQLHKNIYEATVEKLESRDKGDSLIQKVKSICYYFSILGIETKANDLHKWPHQILYSLLQLLTLLHSQFRIPTIIGLPDNSFQYVNYHNHLQLLEGAHGLTNRFNILDK